MASPEIRVRAARTSDVKAIQEIRAPFVESRVLLGHESVSLYEAVQEYQVAVDDHDQVIGAGALHVMWEDLAEVRTVAVDPDLAGQGIGSLILTALLQRARDIGVKRVFCLTFAVPFFERHGFHEIDESPVDHNVYEQLLQSYDEGVAEFLGLERVKPNTLGNHRMLTIL